MCQMKRKLDTPVHAPHATATKASNRFSGCYASAAGTLGDFFKSTHRVFIFSKIMQMLWASPHLRILESHAVLTTMTCVRT